MEQNTAEKEKEERQENDRGDGALPLVYVERESLDLDLVINEMS